ncbi:MAG: hypothetical protein EPO63_05685 [Candidatus Nitrosotenuis sp.]|nr:MAG: hypothetical protein EPO63_05685 [Candidatus Nitrosotenuis sp.]
MFPELLFLFGCIPEITKDCQDMTNASSTYLGIAAGAAIGGIISWWVYYRQKKIAEIQDLTLNRIKSYDENHEVVLKRIQDLDSRHEEILNKILEITKKMDIVIEKQKSIESRKSSNID